VIEIPEPHLLEESPITCRFKSEKMPLAADSQCQICSIGYRNL